MHQSEAARRFNMVGTSCPNCGQSFDLHHPVTGECPEESEYEARAYDTEELATLAIAACGADGAYVRIAMLMNNAQTLRRLKRMDN